MWYLIITCRRLGHRSSSLHSRFPRLRRLSPCVSVFSKHRFFCDGCQQSIINVGVPVAYLRPSMTAAMKDLDSAISRAPTPFICTPAPASKTLRPFLSLAMRTSLRSRSRPLTVSGSSKSSDACDRSIWLSSSQWYGKASGAAFEVLEGKKGAETSRAVRSRYSSEGRVVAAASGGGGEKRSSLSTSMSRIAERASGLSQGGGSMFARRWRFSSKASHRGSGVGNGGVSALVGPYLESQ